MPLKVAGASRLLDIYEKLLINVADAFDKKTFQMQMLLKMYFVALVELLDF
jgi:hypothetical protein